MWDTGGDDWNSNGDYTAKRISDAVGCGSIICLHDGRALLRNPDIQPTLDALRLVIPVLLDKGLQFQSLSSLLDIPTDSKKAE
jgi:hypothetical protein